MKIFATVFFLFLIIGCKNSTENRQLAAGEPEGKPVLVIVDVPDRKGIAQRLPINGKVGAQAAIDMEWFRVAASHLNSGRVDSQILCANNDFLLRITPKLINDGKIAYCMDGQVQLFDIPKDWIKTSVQDTGITTLNFWADLPNMGWLIEQATRKITNSSMLKARFYVAIREVKGQSSDFNNQFLRLKIVKGTSNSSNLNAGSSDPTTNDLDTIANDNGSSVLSEFFQ